MRITMKTLYSTPEFTASPGDTIEVPAKLGKQLIERRYAVAAKSDPAKAAEKKKADPADDDPQRPAPSASKSKWVAWVVDQYDITEDEAKEMTREQLVAFDEADGETDDPDDDPDGDGDGDDGE